MRTQVSSQRPSSKQRTPNLYRSELRGIWLHRQLPDEQASMSSWFIAYVRINEVKYRKEENAWALV